MNWCVHVQCVCVFIRLVASSWSRLFIEIYPHLRVQLQSIYFALFIALYLHKAYCYYCTVVVFQLFIDIIFNQ